MPELRVTVVFELDYDDGTDEDDCDDDELVERIKQGVRDALLASEQPHLLPSKIKVAF